MISRTPKWLFHFPLGNYPQIPLFLFEKKNLQFNRRVRPKLLTVVIPILRFHLWTLHKLIPKLGIPDSSKEAGKRIQGSNRWHHKSWCFCSLSHQRACDFKVLPQASWGNHETSPNSPWKFPFPLRPNIFRHGKKDRVWQALKRPAVPFARKKKEQQKLTRTYHSHWSCLSALSAVPQFVYKIPAGQLLGSRRAAWVNLGRKIVSESCGQYIGSCSLLEPPEKC